MNFKSPGGNLTWLTPLLFLAGLTVAYIYVTEGSLFLAALVGVMAVSCLLIWFQQRWAAFLLAAYFVLAFMGGCGLMIARGFSWSMLAKVLMSAFTIFELLEWAFRDDHASDEDDGLLVGDRLPEEFDIDELHRRH